MSAVFNHVVHKRGHIVSAEPASAWSSVATKNGGVDREREDLTQVTPSLQGSCTTGGTNIWTETPETSPETEPPQEKRAKRDSENELEEGEIAGSSEEDEEDKVDEEGETKDTPHDNGCGDAKGPANDLQVMEDELGARMEDNVNGSINKDSDSSRDQCANEDITGPSDDNSAATASAEVSVTKEDALK